MEPAADRDAAVTRRPPEQGTEPAGNESIARGTPTLAAVRTAICRATGVESGALEFCETHLSVVILAGDGAYKLLRAVVLPFVDHGSLAARRRSCEAELRRNRMLAADVYLRVRSVVPEPDGYRLSDVDDPAAIEYLVEMTRFDSADTLAERARRDEVPAAVVERIATTLVAYHAAARRLPDAATPARASSAAAQLIDANLDELIGLLDDRDDRDRVERIRRRLLAYVRDHDRLLAGRRADGWIRDLHGDLRAEHVVVDARRVRIVDAIEFSPDLHEIDVADELAFLSVDLEAQGAGAVAARLLEAYRTHGGDPGPTMLRAFYGAHRACVRAKVTALRSLAGDDRYANEARRLLAVAERNAWRSRGPRAYVVCGPSGSGKSHLAERLGGLSGLAVVSSDVVRKHAAGLRATDRAAPALYSPASSRTTYEQLGRLAAAEIDGGSGVVVDATCLRREDRRALVRGITPEYEARLVYIGCEAPSSVLRERVGARLRGRRVSDADLDVLERQLVNAEPLDEIPAQRHFILRTDAPVARLVARLTAMFDA